jgi:hypothetical protein
MRGRVSVLKGKIFSSNHKQAASENYGRTFEPLSDKERILKKLEAVAAELEKDMQSCGWTGKTVTLKFKLDTYQGTSLIRLSCQNIDPLLHSIHSCQVVLSLGYKERRSICSKLVVGGQLLTTVLNSPTSRQGRSYSCPRCRLD